MSNEEFVRVECVKSAMRVIKQFCEENPACEFCPMFIDGNYGSCSFKQEPCKWEVDK